MGLYQEQFTKYPILLLFIGTLLTLSLTTRTARSRDPAAYSPQTHSVAPEEVLHNFIELSFHIKSAEGLPVLVGFTTGTARHEFEDMTYDQFRAYFQNRVLEYIDYTVTDLYKMDRSTLFIEYRIGFVDLTPGTQDVQYLNRNRAKLVLVDNVWKVENVEFLDSLASFLNGRKVQVIRKP